MRLENLDNEIEEHGPVYLAIERALWALGPALLLLMLVSLPSMQAARQEAEAELAADIASENQLYCAKWGMAAGSAEHASCVQDLGAIRARAEQRMREAAIEF